MLNWWNPYMGGGGQSGYGMPYGLSPAMWQRPGMGTGTMTSAADVGRVSDAPPNPFAWLYGLQQPRDDPQDEQTARRRRQQQQQLQMAQYGLSMLMPRQPTHTGPYPWI